MTYILPIAMFAGLGALAGILLTVVSKIFAVKTDERLDAVTESLPQINCGACGFSGCADYADAIVNKGAEANLCKAGGVDTAEKISQIMGIEVGDIEPEVAFVRCGGNCNCTEHKYDFEGTMSCQASNRFYNGSKVCTSGCLGYGDCVAVCPNGAVSIVDRIAKVDESKCIGCGLCARECPNNLIAVRKKSQNVEVICSSLDNAKRTKDICSSGCIGCRLCEKKCPVEAIKVINNHAVIDYKRCTSCGTCVEVCRMAAAKLIK